MESISKVAAEYPMQDGPASEHALYILYYEVLFIFSLAFHVISVLALSLSLSLWVCLLSPFFSFLFC
jgi:hypothetical protein